MSTTVIPRSALARSLIIATLVLFATTAACQSSPPGGRSDSRSRANSAVDAIRQGNFDGTLPLVSIGDLIDASDVIVRASVEQIAEPRWNSLDGSDWTAEFEANPQEFDTIPMPLTDVAVTVEEVIDQAPDSGSPKVEAGDTLTLTFVLDPALEILTPEEQAALGPPARYRYLDVGDERVLFVDWDSIAISSGETDPVWRGKSEFGSWGMVDDAAYPGAFEYVYSLLGAYDAGLLTRKEQPARLVVGISMDDLRETIAAERLTPDRATIASFEQWPWEPAYREYASEDEPTP